MTDRDREVSVKLKYEIDQSAANRAKTAAADFEARIARLPDVTRDVTNTAKQAGAALGRDLAKGLDSSATGIEKLRKQASGAKTDLDNLRRTTEQAGKAAQGLDVGRIAGRGERLFGAARQVVGGGAAGELFGAAGDVAGLSEQLSNLGKFAVPAGIAIAGAGLALQAYNAEVERQRKTIEEQVKANIELAKLRREATTAEIEERKKATEQRIADATVERDRLVGEAAKFNEAIRGNLFGPLQLLNPQLRGTLENVKTLNEGLQKDQAELASLTKELQNNAFAANDAKKAQEELTNQILQITQNRVARELEAQNLIRTATVAQVKEKIAATQAEYESTKELIKQLQAIPNPTAEVTAALKAAVSKQLELQASLGSLKDKVLPAVEASERFKKGIEGITTGLKNAADKAAEFLRKQLQEEADRRKNMADAVQKFNDDVKKIDDDYYQSRAESERKHADNLVEIAAKAAEDSEAALKKLEQRRTDLRRDFERGEVEASQKTQQDQLDLQIQAQRDEAKAFRDHQRNLEKIRKDAQDREFELILNRDFAGLFFSRRQTNKQLEEATGGFLADRTERARQTSERASDLARQAAQERAQRLATYQQNLADARAQYIQERAEIVAQKQDAINKAREAHQRELADLATKYQRELQLRRTAIERELQLVSMSASARLRLEQQTQNALFQQAQRILQSVSAQQAAAVASYRGPNAARSNFRAGGGSVYPGQSYVVNDAYRGQRESFNGTPFPPGMGMFFPMQAGNVSPGTGPSINMPITISGAGDPAATARAVRAEMTRGLEAIFGRAAS